MNIVLEGPIVPEALDKLTKAYNELEEKGGALHIFFSSEGGEVTTGEAIIELINRYQGATTLTAYGLLASMGFRIFAEVKCQRVVLDSVYAICHLSRWGTQILEGGKALDDYARFKEQHMKKKVKKSIQDYKAYGLNEDEIKAMQEGKDVYVDSGRLRKMFKIKE